MENWVFVDTGVWISFFGKPSSPEKAAVDELLKADRVALIGPILAEVLLGFRRTDQAHWVASRMRLCNYQNIDWQDWRISAQLGRELAAGGAKLPLSDLILAAIANRYDSWLYSQDPHFDLIPDLKRYRPNK